MIFCRVAAILCLLALSLICRHAKADPTGETLWVHDPSRALECDGKFYLYTTGDYIPSRVSKDGIHWEKGANVLDKLPDWIKQLVPRADGKVVWAPDVIKNQNEYWLFYSYSTFGSQTSAIGLLSNSTLNPNHPDYKWSDRGLVVATDGKQQANAIDPAPIFDEAGALWMSYGSWNKGGIQLVELDKTSGKPLGEPTSIAGGQATGPEAPYLHFRGGYYYLFENEGLCCQGLNSTYRVMMGRSKNIAGPYLDRAGRELGQGGGTVFLETAGEMIGPGHIGIASREGLEMVTYHYYGGQTNGVPALGARALVWDDAGWPVAAPALSSGRYAILNRASGLALGVRDRSVADGAPLDQFAFNGDAMQSWNVVALGDGFYGIASLGSGQWLDLFECNAANGAAINQQPWLNNDCQRWRIEAIEPGVYRLVSKGGGTALTLPDGAKTPRALMRADVWTSAQGQQWVFRALP